MLAQVNELCKCVQANQKQFLTGHLIKLEVSEMWRGE